MLINCWTFHAHFNDRHMKMDAGLLTTLDARRPRENTYHVIMTLGHFGYRVRIADMQMIKVMPGSLGWVFEADLTEADETTLADEASYELTPVKDDASQTLLLVKSGYEVISNQGRSEPHFVDCNTWVGADGPGLMMQTGRHQSSSKQQLFRLLPDQSIFFIDSVKEVTRITAGKFGDKPSTRRATAGEVADYVLNEAKARGKDNPSTRTWCYYALKELGCQHQIDAFTQMFPGFRRK